MSTPEVRRSPDGYLVAVMTTAGWAVCSAPLGMLVDEDRVAGWTPLLPVSNQDGADPEQLPPVLDRAADELHRGH